MRNNRTTLAVCLAATALAVASAPSPVSAQAVPVYGGPTYTPGVGGYQFGGVSSFDGVNGAAIAVKYDAAGVSKGPRPFRIRLDASGTPQVTELGVLGTDTSGSVGSISVISVDGAGNIIGWLDRYDGSGQRKGFRAVRWGASGTVPTEFANLGTNASGYTESYAGPPNSSGAVAGHVTRFDASGSDIGTRAVWWDASGAVNELGGNLGTRSNGQARFVRAHFITDAGTVFGSADRYDGAGEWKGERAVRWDPSGSGPTELANLGTDPRGYVFTQIREIHSTGGIGVATHYDPARYPAAEGNLGTRTVRWNASGTSVTALGDLGPRTSGYYYSEPYATNNAGMAVGVFHNLDDGVAVRWDASGVATELGHLGDPPSVTPLDINNVGVAVGTALASVGAATLPRAVYWGADAAAVDLNTLIDPASGWTLTAARSISDDGWIGGEGKFDPDGPGGQAPYDRMYLIHVPATVPEPGGLALLALAGPAFLRRRRRQQVDQRASC